MSSSVNAWPENDNVLCARGDEGWFLKLSAKLERWLTLGEESFRGVCSGVVVVEETAVEERVAGRGLGERLLPADDVGREEDCANVCAAIGMEAVFDTSSGFESSIETMLAGVLPQLPLAVGHSRLGTRDACEACFLRAI